MCDPRDLAFSMLKACEKEEIKNERFIVSQETIWMHELCQILKEIFKEQYDGPLKP